MNSQLERMLLCAEAWQNNHRRTLEGLIEKVKEEVHEFLTATTKSDKLNEAGDVIANALRIFVQLSENEREFMISVMEMKVDKRLSPGGVKDKEAEAEAIKEFEELYLNK